MAGGKIWMTPVAKAVPFDNGGNGFTASNIQTAIEEINANTFQPTEITATGSISTSSSNFSTMTSMTVSLSAGTYWIVFSGSTLATNDSDGEIAIFANSSQVTHSTRRIYCEASGLLGAVSTASMGSHTMAMVTLSGTQTVEVKYRATSGTVTVTNRNLTYIQIRPTS